MCDSHLDPGHHSVLLLAIGVLFPRSTVLRDHTDELLVSRHDRRDGGEKTGAEHEIAQAGDVDQGRCSGKSRGQEIGLYVGGSKGVEYVQTPSEDVEGNGEMDQTRMGRKAVHRSQWRWWVESDGIEDLLSVEFRDRIADLPREF